MLETHAVHRKAASSQSTADCGGFTVAGLLETVMCQLLLSSSGVMRCYSSVTFTENEAENQYLLCHSRRERERKVQLTWAPYVSVTVGPCFICRAERNALSRLNYRLELLLQLRPFNKESSLLPSPVPTITSVRGLVSLWTSLFLLINWTHPPPEITHYAGAAAHYTAILYLLHSRLPGILIQISLLIASAGVRRGAQGQTRQVCAV